MANFKLLLSRVVRVFGSSSPLRTRKDSAQHSRRRDSVALSAQGTRFLTPTLSFLTGTECPAPLAAEPQAAPGMDHEDPTLDVEAALRDEEALAALTELGAASTAPDEEPSATPPGDAAATPGEPGSDAEKAPSGPPQRGSTVRGGRGPASAPAGGVFWGSRPPGDPAPGGL